MSNDAIDFCRLCSASTNLIAMFCGKSRSNRDALRKMIEEILHIRIEQNDAVSSVCFDCLVDVTNFYFFMLHCEKNQVSSRALSKPNEAPLSKTLKSKVSIQPLQYIQRPNIDGTQRILEWLNKKRVGLREPEENTSSMLEKACQTHQPCADAFTQCNNIVETASKACESNSIEPYIDTIIPKESKESQSAQPCDDAFTQSPQLETTSREYQADTKAKTTSCYSEIAIPKTLKIQDSCAQTEIIETEVADHGNKKTKLQALCRNIINVESFIPQISILNSCTQTDESEKSAGTELGNVETELKILRRKLNVESFIPEPQKVVRRTKKARLEYLCEKMNNKDFCQKLIVERFSQTEEPDVTDKEVQCTLIHVLPNNHLIDVSFDKQCQTDAFDQCDMFSVFSGFYDKREVGLVDSKLNIKVILKDEPLSPLESLTIPAHDKSLDMQSPNSSGLLQVKEKSQDVKICKFCDTSLYSKKEILLHNKTHMQCTFCKKKFRSFKATNVHMESCKLESTSLLCVDLIRVDNDPNIQAKYPLSFQNIGQ